MTRIGFWAGKKKTEVQLNAIAIHVVSGSHRLRFGHGPSATMTFQYIPVRGPAPSSG